MLLKGKTAIVTGCNRGIGAAILRAFAQNGANVLACARSKTDEFAERMGALARECSVEIQPIGFDLQNEPEVTSAMADIRRSRRRIDILVNNAGALPENILFQMMPMANMQKLFEVNFFAQIRLVQYVSRLMQRNGNGGSIIQMASVAAMDGTPGQMEYVSSKAAIVGATRALAREFGRDGIRVNAIAPGLIDTEMGKAMPDRLSQDIIAHSALGRWGMPEDVAGVAVFLASDLSSYVTGQVIRVDGGIKIGSKDVG